MGNTSVNELLTSYLTCKKCGMLCNISKDVTYHLKSYKLESMAVTEEPTTYCLCSKCYNDFLEWVSKKEDCPKEDTNQKTLLGLNITKATLLTDRETEHLPQRLLEYNNWWWLRSSGITSSRAAFVFNNGSVADYGCYVFNVYPIRPALIISNLELSNLKIGDTFEFGDKEFEIVSDDKAFCLTDIGNCAFRKDYKAPDSNDYEKSDVKKYVDNWFDTAKEIDNEGRKDY